MPIPLGILAVAGAGSAPLVNSFDLLESTILSTTATSIVFSSLGSYSDYKHLQIRMVGRNVNTSIGGARFILRFNSDSGSNYATHWLKGNGTAVTSGNITSTTGIGPSFGNIANNGATTNAFGGNIVDILDFYNSSKNTTVRTFGGTDFFEMGLGSGFWNNTAAVTRIEIIDGSFAGGFVAGSRFSLYGWK